MHWLFRATIRHSHGVTAVQDRAQVARTPFEVESLVADLEDMIMDTNCSR